MDIKMKYLLLKLAGFAFLIQICTSNEFHNLDDVEFVEEDHPHDKCTRRRMDVIFILDESSSIPPAVFRKEKRFVAQMLRQFDIGMDGTRVGVLSFADMTRIHVNLKDFGTRLQIWSHIKKIRQFGGNTDTGEALRILRTYAFHPAQGARIGTEVPQICIVVTDGGSQRHDLTKLQALRAKAKGYIMFSVGVGPESDEEELRNIASNIHYILSHEDHVHAAEVSCDATDPPPLSIIPGCADNPIDLVFVLDNSNSIPHSSYDKMMEFVADIVMGFNIGKDATRVALIKFASDALLEFRFDSYYDREDASDAIRTTSRLLGGTYTYYALKLVETEVLVEDHGARPGVPKVAMVITDGNSATRRHTLWQAKVLRERYNVRFFALGVGHNIDINELYGIVGPDNEADVFMVETFEHLIEFRETMVLKTCGGAPSRAPPTTPVPINIQPGCDSKQADVMFVIDSSTSITQGDYEKMMKFINYYIQSMDVGSNTRVGVIMYASSARTSMSLGAYNTRERAGRAAENIRRLRGSSDTADAIKTLHRMNNRFRKGVLKIGIVLTDGRSDDKAATLKEAQQARDLGILLFVLGIGGEPDKSELNGIVGNQNSLVYSARDFDALSGIANSMIRATCNAEPLKPKPVAKKVDVGLTRDFKPQSSNPIARINTETRLKFDLKIQNVEKTSIERLSRREKNYAVDFYFSQANLEQTPISRTNVHKLKNIVEPGMEFGLIGNGPASSLITFDTSGTLPGKECNKYVWFCACVREGDDAKYTDADDSNNCQCRPAQELISCSPDIMVVNFDPKDNEYLRGEEIELSDIALNVKNGADRDPGNNILRAKRGDNYKIQLHFAKADLAKNPNAKKTPPFPATLKTGDLSVALDATRITPQQRMRAKVMLPDEDDCAEYLWLCACVSEASGAEYKDSNPNNNCECKDVSPFIKCVFLPLQPIFDGCVGKVADVFFIVDSSSGITDTDYQTVLKFVQLMALGMDIGRTKTHVGVISVADTPMVAFQLNEFSDREAAAMAIPEVPRQRGRSNRMAEALIMMQEYNAPQNGGRAGALKVGIVITSGLSADAARTKAEAMKARDAGYVLFAIGADRFDFDELEGIADIPYSETRLFTSYSYRKLSRNVAPVVEEMCRLKPLVIVKNPDLAIRGFVVADESPIMVMDKDGPMMMNVVLENKEGADIKRLNRREKNYALDFYVSQDNLEVTPKSDTRTVLLKTVREPMLDFGLDVKGAPSSVLKFATEGKLPIRRCNDYVWLCACAREGSDAPWIDADRSNNCKCQDAKEKISCSPDIKVTNFDPKKNEFLRGEETEISDLSLNVQNAADRQPGNDIFKAKTGDNFAIDLHFAQADLAKNPRAVKTPPFPATLKTGDLSVALKAASITGRQRMKAKVTLPDEDGCAQYVWLCACVRESRGAEYKDANPNNNCECKDVSPFLKCVLLPDQKIFDGCVGKVADVFFLVDSSSGINDADYQKILEFVQLMALGMDIAEAKTRVGVISVADRPAVAFQLNKHFNREDAALAIPKVERQRGRSNKMAEALIMMQEYNAAGYGGRAGALKVGIVITSGLSADAARTRAEAKKARDDGYILFAIGVDRFDFDELEGIADIPYSETRLFTSYSYRRLSRNVPPVVEEMCRLKPPAKNPDLVLNDFKVADDNLPMVVDQETDLSMSVVLENKDGANITPLRTRQTNYAVDFYVSQANLVVTPIADTKAVLLRTVTEPSLYFGLNAKGTPSSLLKFGTRGKLPSEQCNKYVWFCACAREGTDAPWKDADTSNNCKCNDASEKISCAPDIQTTDFQPNADGMTFMKGEEVELTNFNAKVKNSGPRIAGNNIQSAKGGDNFAIVLHFAQADLAVNPTAKKSPAFPAILKTGDLSVALRAGGSTADQKLNSKITHPADECEKYVWLCACVLEGAAAKYKDNNPNNNCECKDVSPQVKCEDTAAACKGKPVDVVFIIDNSNSIRNDDYIKMIDFVETLIGSFDIGVDKARIGMVTYASESQVRFELNKYSDSAEIIHFVDNMRRQHGGTQTGDALEEAREHTFQEEHGARPGVLKVALVITDGVSANRRQTLAEAKLTRDHGIRVYAIGIGPGVDQGELLGIAGTENQEQVFSAQTFEALTTLREKIIEDTCTATPAPPHVVSCKGKPADVVFIIDNSNSIRRKDYIKMIDFVETLVGSFEVGLTETRIGVVTYASEALVRFELNKYGNAPEIIEYVDTMRRQYGGTETGEALAEAREHTFKTEHGARPNVIKVAIVITDGVSANRQQTLSEARKTRDQGIKVFAVGIGPGVDKSELAGIAGPGNPDQVFSAATFEALEVLIDRIVQETCSESKKFKYMFADAPAVAQIQLPPPCEATPSDVVFILDNSASVQSDEYHDMITFAKSVVKEFNIGTRLNQTKVAAVMFASAARVGFYLNENRNFFDYAKSFNEIRRLYGHSNTADALRLTRVSALSPFRGARPGVQKLVVLITDGRSNNRGRTVAEAKMNLAEGIETVAIGVGRRISTKELHDIVGPGPGRRILTVESFRRLSKVKDDVVKARCSRG